MATAMRVPAVWASRRRRTVTFEAAAGILAVAITLTQLGDIRQVLTTQSWFWLMFGVALLAGTQAFIAGRPAGQAPIVICPTICFTFAIQLCWGLGPAIVAQTAAVAVGATRLKAGMRGATWAASHFALAFAAASVVLSVGNPDPFMHHGPTNVLVDAISVAGAAAAWLLAYGALDAARARIRRGSQQTTPGSATTNQMLFNAALLLLSPVLAVTEHVDVGFVPLVVVPLYAVHRMAKLSAQ
ncbi:MAG TPA: hypothetical protein VH442_06030, partial [Micromonosporaceae bacterium]